MTIDLWYVVLLQVRSTMGKKLDLTPRKKARIETVLTETTMNQVEIAAKYGVSQCEDLLPIRI